MSESQPSSKTNTRKANAVGSVSSPKPEKGYHGLSLKEEVQKLYKSYKQDVWIRKCLWKFLPKTLSIIVWQWLYYHWTVLLSLMLWTSLKGKHLFLIHGRCNVSLSDLNIFTIWCGGCGLDIFIHLYFLFVVSPKIRWKYEHALMVMFRRVYFLDCFSEFCFTYFFPYQHFGDSHLLSIFTMWPLLFDVNI